ncbi:MAG: type II toxin-antitoxin system RelE/ParE family toxin [Bacteroidetes bacterium]|nr:MAG: type II toxin-antitoxin system RelE/ParE family toxin [Bacteroidota bacterium]
MDIVFDKSFSKSLDKIKSNPLKSKIEQIIIEMEGADSIKDIRKLKKMTGHKLFFRIRIGDYRLGLELENNNILRLIVIAHRKDIYKIFP